MEANPCEEPAEAQKIVYLWDLFLKLKKNLGSLRDRAVRLPWLMHDRVGLLQTLIISSTSLIPVGLHSLSPCFNCFFLFFVFNRLSW